MFQSPTASADTTPEHPRVIWLEDPAHSATLVWITDDPGDDHRAYFDTQPRNGETDAYRHEIEASRTIEETNGNVWFHHAELDDLHPSTTYHFTVESDGETGPERHFETAPADDRPVDLLYGGDSRSNPENRREVNRRIRTLFDENDRLIGMIHGGDYVETALIWDQLAQWLDDWELTNADDGGVIPIVPARGNHEFSPAQATDELDNYNGMFGLPGGPDNDYWTTTIGSRIAIVTLDTNGTLGGEQREWLDEQLATLTDEYTWVIPSYHRPAYPAVKRAGAARQHWVPLFEQYDVDLVLESDGHVLKRTVPIRDGEQADDGIVYVGEGGLGVKQRSPKDRWFLESPGMATASHHVQLLSFGPEKLDYRAIALDGSTLDEATFEARRDTSPTPIAIDSLEAPAPDRLELDFNKGIAPDSIEIDDFSVAPDTTVTDARLHEDYDDHVVLATSPLDPGTEYTVEATDLSDLLGQTLEQTLTASIALEEEDSPGGASDDTSADSDDANAGDITDSSDSPDSEPSSAAPAGCSTTTPGPAPLAPLAVVVIVATGGWRRNAPGARVSRT